MDIDRPRKWNGRAGGFEWKMSEENDERGEREVIRRLKAERK